MPSPSSSDSVPLLPLFSSPRPAPVPFGPASIGSSHSSPPPEGFVMPQIPPPNFPKKDFWPGAFARRAEVSMSRSTGGLNFDSGRNEPISRVHVSLPGPHSAYQSMFLCPPSFLGTREKKRSVSLISRTAVIKYRDVVAKCANCAELAIDCDFSEAGIPCPPCAVLGIPDCNYADPYFFVSNLANRRDAYLHDERAVLCAAVRDNHLAASQFGMSLCLLREYERASTWFYSAAQGAITRFLVNCHATGGLAFRGYQRLAESSTDAGLLSRFLVFGHDARIHPSVLQAVVDRLYSLFFSLLES
ncbi:hypothetical protein FB451DRAFT_1171753 [Mycena latifolia]|nr:hypothetical protein FB451DRAFT_1171753 [Mycena latifolia]